MNRRRGDAWGRVLGVLLLLLPGAVATAGSEVDPQLFSGMKWRQIGPFRGGRVVAVSGVAQGSAVLTTPADNSRPMNIGFSWGGGTPFRFFRGALDELQIYSRALSPAEISVLSAAGTAGTCKN